MTDIPALLAAEDAARTLLHQIQDQQLQLEELLVEIARLRIARVIPLDVRLQVEPHFDHFREQIRQVVGYLFDVAADTAEDHWKHSVAVRLAAQEIDP